MHCYALDYKRRGRKDSSEKENLGNRSVINKKKKIKIRQKIRKVRKDGVRNS